MTSYRCPDCAGDGWVLGVGTDTECCGGSEYECGGRGCTGPQEVQVQVQEPCERCRGTGEIPVGITVS